MKKLGNNSLSKKKKETTLSYKATKEIVIGLINIYSPT